MFCQPHFIASKILAFLKASIDWSKINLCYRNNFDLMRLQYSFTVFVYYWVRAPTLRHFQPMQLGPNNFILLQYGWHQFSVLLLVHNSSFDHVVSSSVKPCSGFLFSHSLSPPVIIVSHFVHLLVEQLYVKEVYFC